MPDRFVQYYRSLAVIVSKRVPPVLKGRLHPSRRRIVFAVQFLVASLLAFSAEKALEYQFESGGAASNPLTQPVLAIDAVYHRIVVSGPRKPRPHFTTLIEIASKTDPGVPSRDRICDQRAFLGILLTKLAGAHVAAVVIDKHFKADVCRPDDPGTTALRNGARALCDTGTPLVVARTAVQPDLDHGYPRIVKDEELSAPSRPCELAWGIDNTNPDTRRVPLIWYCQRLNGGPDEVDAYPGLALAASRAVDLDLEKSNKRLAGFVESGTHPYTSFVRPEQWDGYWLTAGQVVCGRPIAAYADWQSCGATPINDAVRRRLHGRVVVIGEVSPYEDQHAAVIGNVPGYLLQANFIESILDDRLYSPMSEFVNYLAGFAFFALCEYVLEEGSRRGLIRTVIALIALVVSAAAIVYFVILHLGYYLNPAAVSVMYIIVKVSSAIFSKVKDRPLSLRNVVAEKPQ
jgi:hypothetical protein